MRSLRWTTKACEACDPLKTGFFEGLCGTAKTCQVGDEALEVTRVRVLVLSCRKDKRTFVFLDPLEETIFEAAFPCDLVQDRRQATRRRA